MLSILAALLWPFSFAPAIDVVMTEGNQNISGTKTFTGTAGLTIATGVTLNMQAGSTLTVSGSFGGTPTGGTLNLSNTTLTVPISSLRIGTSTQAYSANLDEYAAVNPTAAGLALMDDADNTAQRDTLGLGTMATQAADAVAITGGAIGETTIRDVPQAPAAFLLPKVGLRMYNTASPRQLRVLLVGDSLMSGFGQRLREALVDYVGEAGYGLATTGTAYTALAGGAAASTSSIWPGQLIITVPPGGSVDFKYNTTGSTLGNTFKVFYAKEPSAGTYKIQSSTDGGSNWVDELTGIDASNASLIGAIAEPTPKAFTGQYMLRVVNTGGAGNVRIFGAEISNSLVDGVITHNAAWPGTALTTMVAADPNVIDPILTEMNPDLVVYLNTDGTAAQTANLANYHALMDTTGTADWLFVGIPPNNRVGADSSDNENDAIRAVAEAVGAAYFDTSAWGGSWSTFEGTGLSSDGLHGTNACYAMMSAMVARQVMGSIPNTAGVRPHDAHQWTQSGTSIWQTLPGGYNEYRLRTNPDSVMQFIMRNANGSTHHSMILKLNAANDATNPSGISIGGFVNKITIGNQSGFGYGASAAPTSGWTHDFAPINARGTIKINLGAISPGDALGVFNSSGLQLFGINNAGGLWWEGTDNAHETTLNVIDPTADRTINLPDLSGTVLLGAAQTVALAADDQSITVTGNLVEITSDDATATNRTFVLAAGSYAGQRITLMFRSSGNNCELLNTGTAVLTAAWEPGNLDTLDLIYSTTESKWVETSRASKP